jgi:hypothetical protein
VIMEIKKDALIVRLSLVIIALEILGDPQPAQQLVEMK